MTPDAFRIAFRSIEICFLADGLAELVISYRVEELLKEGLILLRLNNSYEASSENYIGTSLKCPCCFQALVKNFLIGPSSYWILGIGVPKLLSLN